MLRPGASPRNIAGAETAGADRQWAKRALDVVVAGALLLVLAPLFLAIAVAIKLESPGGVFYACERIGYRARRVRVLKFRKMGEGARGPALTAANDSRFTRLGRFLAASKLDELPQLLNVLAGSMSLVGPRPEDVRFASLYGEEYAVILGVRPGITGLCQLAFAKESAIIGSEDPEALYVTRLLPQKVSIDRLYATNRTLLLDLRIIAWTLAATLLRRDVAVHRETGRLSLRRERRELRLPTACESPAAVAQVAS